jgi:DnaJ-domain-containing protein 1
VQRSVTLAIHMKTSCWFCDQDIDDALIESEGCLVPRHSRDGGPLRVFTCPNCGTENGAERNGAGASLLVPIVHLGFQGAIDGLFDRHESVLQAHARAWFLKNVEVRSAFHGTPAAPWPGTESPPRRDPEPAPTEPEKPEAEPTPPRPATRDFDALLAHYATLELSLDASEDDVQAAYRRLSQKCHPDKVAHLDEDFQALADRKFRRLKLAYEAIIAGLTD